MKHFIQQQFKKIQNIVSQIEADDVLLKKIENSAEFCLKALKQGGKILFAGNGGSAADSQHLAAEIVVRLRFNRPGLAAIALTTDSSVMTAVSNDNGYEQIFARQIEALAQPQDVLIAISTSGKSPNILQALASARMKGMTIIGFSGESSPQMDALCHIVLNVPSTETSKIQECHIMFGHIICEMIEARMYPQYDPTLQAELNEQRHENCVSV